MALRTDSRFRHLVAFVALCAFLIPIIVAWQATSSSAATASACVAGDVPVSMVDFAYSPASVTVVAGKTVCWTNNGSAPHSATSDTAVFNSGNLSPAQTFRFTFNTPGNYPYHCAVHPFNMFGSVRVLPRHLRTGP